MQPLPFGLLLRPKPPLTEAAAAGGFHVWPRSHRLLWKKVLREYSTVGDGTNGGARDIGQDEVSLSSGDGDGEGEEYSAEEYEKTMEVIRAQQPVEFTGEGGDVLLCAAPACPSELP